MIQRISSLSLMALYLAFVGARATAEELHASAYADAGRGADGNGPQSGTTSAVSFSSNSSGPEPYGYILAGDAHAAIGGLPGSSIQPQSLLALEARAEMSNVSWLGGGVFYDVRAGAEWRDEFSLSTGGIESPFLLQFNFFSHAYISYEEAYSLNHAMGARIEPLPSSDGFGLFHGTDQSGTLKYGYAAGKDELTLAGWTTYDLRPTAEADVVEFLGVLSLVLEVNPDPLGLPVRGSLLFGSDVYLELVLSRDGPPQSASFDGMRTGGISSVMVIDPTYGAVTPESLGMSLTFASGMSSPNVSAVPEPRSLISAGFGLIGMTVALRYRRRAAV